LIMRKRFISFELICENGRDGIIYEKVMGETLSSKTQDTNEEELTAWIKAFAGIHKELLSHHINSVMDYKDFLKLFTADSIELIRKFEKRVRRLKDFVGE
jgi:hypothetical protein